MQLASDAQGPDRSEAIDTDRVRSMRFGLVNRGFDQHEVLDLVAELCDEIDVLHEAGPEGAAPAAADPGEALLARLAVAVARLEAAESGLLGLPTIGHDEAAPGGPVADAAASERPAPELSGIRAILARGSNILDGIFFWLVVALTIAVIVLSVIDSPYQLLIGTKPESASRIVQASGVPKDAGISYGVVEQGIVTWSEMPFWWWRARSTGTWIKASDAYGPQGHRDAHLSRRGEAKSMKVAVSAAAARAAGLKVDVGGDGILVQSAWENADVKAGDVIVEVAGRPARSLEDLDRAARTRRPGDRIPIKLKDGRSATMWLVPMTGTRSGWVYEGSLVSIRPTYHGPELATFNEDAMLDKSSAGLAVSILLYEKLAGVDLIRGRNVVATGRMEVSGRVMDVGGVAAKVGAAVKDGADLILVPARQLQDAGRLGPYPRTVRIVGVEHLDDAIQALRVPSTSEAYAASRATGPSA